MKTFEYICEWTYRNGHDFEVFLNEYGEQGWELVGFSVRDNDDGQFRECVFKKEQTNE